MSHDYLMHCTQCKTEYRQVPGKNRRKTCDECQGKVVQGGARRRRARPMTRAMVTAMQQSRDRAMDDLDNYMVEQRLRIAGTLHAAHVAKLVKADEGGPCDLADLELTRRGQ